MYAGLLVDATMIALFACWRLKQNNNGRANADNDKSWPKSLIVSDYGRIQYYESDPPKIGHAPISNVISNTYRTVSIKPYWELPHQANPKVHCTPRQFALAATCKPVAVAVTVGGVSGGSGSGGGKRKGSGGGSGVDLVIGSGSGGGGEGGGGGNGCGWCPLWSPCPPKMFTIKLIIFSKKLIVIKKQLLLIALCNPPP